MESSSKLNFQQRILLEFIWGVCRAFSMLPFFVQYRIIAPIVYLLVYKVFRYRVKVVNENLSYAFADKTEAERKEIRRKFYWVLSDIFVGSIALASPKMGDKFDDPTDPTSEAVLLREAVQKSNILVLTAHFGLWEHFGFLGEYLGTYAVGAYHKLKNPVMDELFVRLRIRNRKNAMVVQSKHTIRFCITHRDGIEGKFYMLGLIADQNPVRHHDSEWIEFLGRGTYFFDGGEKLALKMNLPVYFAYQKQLGRGRYRFACDMIYDGIESVETYEITRRYVARLEEEIRRQPHMWLWTHKRWKHKKAKK